jgi:hypothetical protein
LSDRTRSTVTPRALNQDSGGGNRGFVVVDLGIGDVGVVVDDGVDVGLAYQRVVVLALRLVGDVAELLHIDMEHCARVVMLVTPYEFPGGAVKV